MAVLTVGGRSTGMGAETRILVASKGVEIYSDEARRSSAGKTHWTERAVGPDDGLVVVRDISNAGNHHCSVVRLSGEKVPVTLPDGACVCEEPERALASAGARA